MIRRGLVALLLIAAGLGVLHLLIGFENFAKVDGGPDSEPIRRTRDERGLGGGVKIGGGDESGPAISVSGSGEFRDMRREERALPDGSRIRLRVYELVAEDSETVAADLLRLDRVTARFFQVDDEARPPREVHVATVTARQAFVQVGDDEQGKPSVLEDRDMDLRDVTVESTGEARIRGFRLEVERLLVRHTELGLEFRTPTEDVPLLLTLAGEGEPASLRGLGVRGLLPPREDAESSVVELHIASRPELVHGRSTIRARGPLDYIEDFRVGIGDFSLVDEVVVEGVPGGSAGAVPARARGQRLTGRIARLGGDEPRAGSAERGAGWRSLVLDGGDQRAELVRGDQRLVCDRLHVLPAFGGEPAMFVAEGAPEIRAPTRAGGPLRTVRAGERIYLIDVPRTLAPLQAGFGYPRPPFGRLAGQLAVFEGEVRVEDPVRGLSITAADGMRTLQSADGELSLLAGTGPVEIRGQDLVVRGPLGVELRQDGDRQSIRLGPERPDPAHHFEIERSSAGGTLRISGSGLCRLERGADGSSRVIAESPAGDLAVERGSDALRQAAVLDASIGPANELRGFVARGERVRIETSLPARGARGAEQIRGEAGEIRNLGAAGLRLRGDAVLTRAAGGVATGDLVELHRVGGEVLVVAHGAPATVRGPIESGGEVRDVDLRGAELRLLPGIVPRALVALHGLDPRLATGLTGPLAIAERGVVATAVDPAGRTPSTATGDRLWLRADGGGALLDGSPATVDTRTEDGERIVARAPRIRATGGDLASARAVLLPGASSNPELEVHGSGGARAFRSFRVRCAVPIHADELGLAIDGPFEVRGLGADGAELPDGVRLDAAALQMTWVPGSHDVERLVARGEAVLRYRGITAFGDEMRVDAVRTRLEVESLTGHPAGVEFRGRRLLGELFRADYEAQEVRAWGLRGDGDAR